MMTLGVWNKVVGILKIIELDVKQIAIVAGV